MTYEQAIATVKAGTPVRRTSWVNQNLTLVTNGSDSEIQTNKTTTVSAPYLATQEDMFATDWTT